jgi:hypothetical protein
MTTRGKSSGVAVKSHVFLMLMGAAFCSVSCSATTEDDGVIVKAGAIAGGTEINDPRFGSGYFYLNGIPACSATAINNWWVATNNHCIGHAWQPGEVCFTPGPGSVAKFGGSRNWATNPPTDSPWQQHNIASVCRYPGNGEIGTDQRADLVLMRLTDPFSMTGGDDDWQNPTWPHASSTLPGQTATCFGWGNAASRLKMRSMQYSSVVLPETFNNYFRGDMGVYSPAFIEPGDSGSGCWIQANGVNYLATETHSNPAGVSWATSSYAGSDPFGPRLGVREWMDNLMFATPGVIGYVGLLTSAPGVSSQAKNKLDVFWTDSANKLRQIRYNSGWVDQSPNSVLVGTNPGLASLAPASVSWGPGRIDVFTVGGGNLYHVWFNGSWQPFEQIGGPGAALAAFPPAVSSWGSDRLDIFASTTDGSVRHLWYDHGWGSWENLGGVVNSAPVAVSWGSGRIDLFARGGGNAIYHKWYDGGWFPSQTTWENLGGNMNVGPAVTSYKPGRLDLFGRDASSGNLVHRWFEGQWTNQWIDPGYAIPGRPTAVSWGQGRIDVFAKASNGGLWQTYFPFPR